MIFLYKYLQDEPYTNTHIHTYLNTFIGHKKHRKELARTDRKKIHVNNPIACYSLPYPSSANVHLLVFNWVTGHCLVVFSCRRRLVISCAIRSYKWDDRASPSERTETDEIAKRCSNVHAVVLLLQMSLCVSETYIDLFPCNKVKKFRLGHVSRI